VMGLRGVSGTFFCTYRRQVGQAIVLRKTWIRPCRSGVKTA
jgi:hypothetical protein